MSAAAAAGGGGGVAGGGVVAADAGVSFGGALVCRRYGRTPGRTRATAAAQAPPSSPRTVMPRFGWALVMAPLYHGPAGRGSDAGRPGRVARRLSRDGSPRRAGPRSSARSGLREVRRRKLTFATYVDGLLPIMGGEPVGRLTWVYDGEKFVDGVYEVTCAECKEVLFAADVCPRCHAPGGLRARARDAEPLAGAVRVPVVRRRAAALRRVRARRASSTRASARRRRAAATELHEDGFHGYPRRLPRLRHRRRALPTRARSATRRRRCARGPADAAAVRAWAGPP